MPATARNLASPVSEVTTVERVEADRIPSVRYGTTFSAAVKARADAFRAKRKEYMAALTTRPIPMDRVKVLCSELEVGAFELAGDLIGALDYADEIGG